MADQNQWAEVARLTRMTAATKAEMQDALTLKWGTLKAWSIKSETARAALEKLNEAGSRSMSVMAQKDNTEQVDALCGLIDAVNCETIHNGWSGYEMNKQEAKDYVREYCK